MKRSDTGFTFIEILVALAIAAMGLIAVGQLITGASRTQTTADTIAINTMLADRALEYAVMPGDAGRTGLHNTLNEAMKTGARVVVTRQNAPVSGFQAVHVTVTTDGLPHRIELTRLVRMAEYDAYTDAEIPKP